MADKFLVPSRWIQYIDRVGPLVALVVVWGLFAGREWDTFATWENTQTILLNTAVVGIAALGATMIIISGGIDLSVGSLIALVSVAIAFFTQKLVAGTSGAGGMGPGVAASLAAMLGIAIAGACGLAIAAMITGRVAWVAGIAVGALVGYILLRYGFTPWSAGIAGVAIASAAWWGDWQLKTYLPLSPFIVTLGMWGALRGAAKGLANNSAIYPPDTPLKSFMQLPQAEVNASLLWHPQDWWSPGVWIFLLLAALTAGLLRYTQFGRHIFAVGSNEQTARLCGINVERTKLKIYTLAAMLAGVAGVMQFCFLGMGDPTTASGYELKVIAAVVIGGASLTGGVGTILGTVAGALLLNIIDNGCTKIGLEVWMQEILTGAIIVAAVVLDQVRQRAAAR